MLVFRRSRRIVATILLVSAALLATSCAPAATPAPTPQSAATGAPSSPAPPAAVATPTPAEEDVATPTAEAAPEVSDYLPEIPRMSLEELKQLLDSGARITILDNRPQESYQMGHIKGAISLPWKPLLTLADLEMAGIEYFPSDVTVITYCDCGPDEADSAGIAQQLIEMGVTEDVKVLAHPSIEGWIEAGYPTE